MPYEDSSNPEFFSRFYQEDDAPSLEKIKQRLAAVIPGFWHADESDGSFRLFRGNMQILKAPKRDSNHAEYWPEPEEADLFVCAYRDMQWLVEKIQRAQAALTFYASGQTDDGTQAASALEDLA